MPVASRAKAKAKAKANEIVIITDHRDTTQGNAAISKKEKAKAKDSKETVTTAAREGIPHGSVRKARKEESQRKRRQLQRTRKRKRMELGKRAKLTGRTPS